MRKIKFLYRYGNYFTARRRLEGRTLSSASFSVRRIKLRVVRGRPKAHTQRTMLGFTSIIKCMRVRNGECLNTPDSTLDGSVSSLIPLISYPAPIVVSGSKTGTV